MDCGWQNPEEAANSHSACLKVLASNAGCIGRAALRQTSYTQGFLSQFAMMKSFQQTSDFRVMIARIQVEREARFQTDTTPDTHRRNCVAPSAWVHLNSI